MLVIATLGMMRSPSQDGTGWVLFPFTLGFVGHLKEVLWALTLLPGAQRLPALASATCSHPRIY